MPESKKQTLRGNKTGFLFFKIFLKFGGLYAAYALLLGVSLHYWLFDRVAVKTGSAYLKRRFPNDNRVQIRLKVYLLFYSQGKQLIDRYTKISTAVKFNFDFTGKENLEKIMDSEKGLSF